MILTGNQIRMAKENSWLDISDWDESRLNPNSYNLRLANELVVYTKCVEDKFDLLEVPFKDKSGAISYRILTREQINKMVENGELSKRIANRVFESFRENHSSHRKEMLLDMKQEMSTYRLKIPEEGFVLYPGVLYLGRTMEYTETHKFVPMLEGRSSVGRLGISIHSTAGFGDIGFCGYWTLEISCVQPVRIYPGVEICQIYYHTIAEDDSWNRHGEQHGDIFIPSDEFIMKYDRGKYQKNKGIQPSMMWKEFKKN